MPLEVPNLPEELYRLPLRPIADQLCRHAMNLNVLLRAGRVVCPLRVVREAAEKARAAARAAAALEGDGRSASSWSTTSTVTLCEAGASLLLFPTRFSIW
jgi:hypothetical protein